MQGMLETGQYVILPNENEILYKYTIIFLLGTVITVSIWDIQYRTCSIFWMEKDCFNSNIITVLVIFTIIITPLHIYQFHHHQRHFHIFGLTKEMSEERGKVQWCQELFTKWVRQNCSLHDHHGREVVYLSFFIDAIASFSSESGVVSQ